MTKRNFIQGALILFSASLIVKIFGFIFQIIIVRYIGTEAIGLYNMVFPLYMTLIVLTTAGLPPAISKMVAEQMAHHNTSGALRILKISLYLLIVLSIIFTVILAFAAPFILNIFYQDSRVTWCFYAMVPGLLIVPISSGLRGFFQGLQDMVPPAVTQCCEQLVRTTLGLLLIFKLRPYGIKVLAMGLSMGMILGELASLLIIFSLFIRRRKTMLTSYPTASPSVHLPAKRIIASLISFGFPTTLTRLTSSLVLTLEASLIPLLLQKIGYNINQAASMYGQFSGVALALLTIPNVLTFSLATSLVPAISEAEAQGKLTALQFRSMEALRLTYLFGLPVATALLLKASGLSQLVFNLPETGTTIRFLALGAIFLYLAQTSNGILQGLGLVNRIFINNIVGAFVKLLAIIYLVKIPELNINGAALAFVLNFIIVCILNLQAIYKNTGFYLKTLQFIIPLLAVLIMGGLIIWQTKILSPVFSTNLVTVISLLSSGLVYLGLIVISGQLNLKTYFNKNKG